jgi:magnesium chelatase family protein
MHSFARVYAAQPWHLSGQIVSVEIDISRGLHNFSVVGLPDKAVEEARDRVSSAIKNSGFPSPKSENHKIVVSLAPADIRKEGSVYDVAIAVGYLIASSTIECGTDRMLFVGELGLDGTVRPIHGALPLAQAAAREGFHTMFVPAANATEAALVHEIAIIPVKSLSQLVEHLVSNEKIEPQPVTEITSVSTRAVTCFSTVRGQEAAKRALEIAAAGGHNILMSGPPGTGKTLLARALVGILPQLPIESCLEVTGIHSIAGTLSDPLITEPPFRCPHHTASYVSLIGGGAIPRPGEATLAHHGILFLDEFPEFDMRVLESLRQPLEDRVVTISRARGTATFPARFMLVAAMNPCPCGNIGSRHKTCRCNAANLARYGRKLSGPIMDRIDIHVTVEHVEYEKLSDTEPDGETSDTIRARIMDARTRQQSRTGDSRKLNAHLTARDLASQPLRPDVSKLLNESAAKLTLSPRAYHRTIKLARTIADLDQSDDINESHILEALQYRPRSAY